MSTPTISPRPSRHRREDEFTGERHVYEPHSIGLPPMRSYLRELWRRREFAVELSRTKLREQHFDTVFGQLWLVLNPLLLTAVYYVLVDILRGGGAQGEGFFAHLMAGIFAYYFILNSLTVGVKSVTRGGRLILNSAFPRALLPLSAVITAFMRFVPTLVIYVPVHIASGLPIGPHLLWVIPIVALFVLLACGLSMLVAAAPGLLPRPRELPALRAADLALRLAGPLLRRRGPGPVQVAPRRQPARRPADRVERRPQPGAGARGVVDAARPVLGVGVFVVAGLFFLSREREFAVRL